MIRSNEPSVRIALLIAAAGVLLLTGCGPAKSSAAGSAPAGSSATGSSGTGSAVATPVGGVGATACGLVTEQDASAAIGSPSGPGTAGGTPALSECMFDDGSLIVSLAADGKALYDQAWAAAAAKGATKIAGVGDAAFEVTGGPTVLVYVLKGSALISIILNGADTPRPDEALVLAKVAVAHL
jgi:hypothetical protein